MLNRRLEVLEFGKTQRFRSGSDSGVVPVEVVADRINCAPDVDYSHGDHHDVKLEVASVTCLESTLLTIATSF